MGHRAALGLWLTRALLLCVTIAAVVVQTTAPARRGGGDIVKLSTRALNDAGYKVKPLSRSWSSGKIVSVYALQAHHTACPQDLLIKILSADSGDPSEVIKNGEGSLFLFGTWTGNEPPSRRQVIQELTMMYVRPLITRRPAPRPKRALQVFDPSSCLILQPVDWTKIWYG